MLKAIGESGDFQIHDCFSKRKHAPYISIKRNIYLTKKIKRRIDDDDGIFCSCAPTKNRSTVCGKDCHCGMLLSSCSMNCKCGRTCLNKPFQNRPVKKLKIVQTERCGCGVVAGEDIKKGEFVTEYVGEVIDDETCAERLWEMKHGGETNFYLCEVNRDMLIDATNKGNKSRFINHGCCPNTEMQKWRMDNETRLGIFAIHDIMKGGHLSYDYQFVQFGADQDCYCGASGCRRKLGAKPNKQQNKVVTPPPSSDSAALKLVTDQALYSSSSAPCLGSEESSTAKQPFRPRTCIGEVIRMRGGVFGIIMRYDNISKKHSVLFEGGGMGLLDMATEDWELVSQL